ncbi:ankyrin repeat domain-containing protein [Saccharicrinis fermentans]|uniref:Ribulose-5-phosphate 4-epimerase and aldolase n=1 Tax=Saccharicrinis fermentans DSM 9555 = JCM 21142 TaxID=869213 RepID=W7YPH4_9BACT|nr:ankyrin repeat domain-containing protein [Saccharicrinis fermentans]GAF04274.1 ribulose-5-phosphate 4-epimerase and aldolase [Saccharicrinis fermentans DSM 9555 = JCM 21142]
MNKLSLLVAITIIASIVYSCDTKTKKTTDTSEISTKKPTTVDSNKSFDIDLLNQSALDGKIETIKNALENGFDANSTDANKRTTLMMAAFNGHTEIVSLLLNNGADVNLTDNINRTALMYASTGPFTTTVLTLLQAGAQPNLIDNEENWTAVMMAAAEGQLEVVKTLVAHGADLTMVDVDGESSLDFANSKGHTQVAEYIKTQIK